MQAGVVHEGPIALILAVWILELTRGQPRQVGRIEIWIERLRRRLVLPRRVRIRADERLHPPQRGGVAARGLPEQLLRALRIQIVCRRKLSQRLLQIARRQLLRQARELLRPGPLEDPLERRPTVGVEVVDARCCRHRCDRRLGGRGRRLGHVSQLKLKQRPEPPRAAYIVAVCTTYVVRSEGRLKYVPSYR